MKAEKFFSKTRREWGLKYDNFSYKVAESCFQNIQHILVIMYDI